MERLFSAQNLPLDAQSVLEATAFSDQELPVGARPETVDLLHRVIGAGAWDAMVSHPRLDPQHARIFLEMLCSGKPNVQIAAEYAYSSRTHLALLTSSGQEQREMAGQREPVDIEGDTEQQCLHLLGGGRAAGGPCRELALGGRGIRRMVSCNRRVSSSSRRRARHPTWCAVGD